MEYKSGDHCLIEQQRYTSANEMHLHKVIGTLKSNFYVDVPVEIPLTETIHTEVVDVVSCVCCGIEERHAFRYRLSDIEAQPDSDGMLTGAHSGK
jgi:hypothetical protein